MTAVDHLSVGDLVVANPSAAGVLDAFGVDYCCHGDLALDEACAAAGADVEAVRVALEGLDVDGDTSWTTLGATALAEHIVALHHRYLWDELPLLDALAAKVLAVHGERHSELGEVRTLVATVRGELEPHLTKEERVLFPAIAALEGGRTDRSFGSIADAIPAMLLEHDQAGELLARLREVTGGYQAPVDGCASYRSLYERLAALELDTHVHIHKENHVLFPAVRRLAGAS